MCHKLHKLILEGLRFPTISLLFQICTIRIRSLLGQKWFNTKQRHILRRANNKVVTSKILTAEKQTIRHIHLVRSETKLKPL